MRMLRDEQSNLHNYEVQIRNEKQVSSLQTLYTIGYEGLSLDSFVHLLRTYSIHHVLDIRRKPFSRKAGFSKTALAQTLAAATIKYTHIVDLGTPEVLRDELKATADYTTFFEKVDNYITQQHTALDTALHLALSQRCVLLCFERHSEDCHRMVVAAQLARLSNLRLSIEHIEL